MSAKLALLTTFNQLLNPSVNWQDFDSSILLEVQREEKVFTCSAVAIARNILLTAAHCVEDITGGRALLDVSYNPKSSNAIAFKTVHIHDGYNQQESNFKHDIALVILEHNLPQDTQHASIQWDLSINDVTATERIGYGGRNKKNIRTWTNPKQMDLISDETITLQDEYSVVGDSGGPVFARTPAGLKLIGIHSTLEGDKKTYSSFVPAYREWIESLAPIKNAQTYSFSSMHK
jgi:V8-like Glu-specific endopeptidase